MCSIGQGYSQHSTIASREQLCFKRDLKTVKLDDDVTLGGRLLHMCATATGKARSPLVARRTRHSWDDESRCRRRAQPPSTHCGSHMYDGIRRRKRKQRCFILGRRRHVAAVVDDVTLSKVQTVHNRTSKWRM